MNDLFLSLGRPPKAPVDILLSDTGVQRHGNETNETEHPNCDLDPNKWRVVETHHVSAVFCFKSKAWTKEVKFLYTGRFVNSAIYCLGHISFEGNGFFCGCQRVFFCVGGGGELLNTYGLVE